jgi:hypothetical protein
MKRRVFLTCLFCAVALCAHLCCLTASANTNSFAFSYENGTVQFTLHSNGAVYYLLEKSADLKSFTPIQMALGQDAPQWQIPVTNASGFFRVTAIYTSIPRDTDGDGMDDYYELNHGLNPLDPSDASLESGLVDVNNNPLTWLQAYRYYYTSNILEYNAVGREVSIFNFGQPAANYEGNSREFSIFNTPLPDSNQNGIDDVYEQNHGLTATSASQPSGFTSDFPNNAGTPLTWLQLYRLNFGANRILYDTASREVSTFNFGQPAANYDSISREVSIFNVPVPDANQDGIDDAYELNHGITSSNVNQPSGFTSDFPNNTGKPLTWLQLYHLNFGANRPLYDTFSREVSAFNFGQPAANYEGISREVSVFNFGQPAANYEALSREFSVFNEP